jgi:nicotinic acid mononucleotide adenylyltransferase
MTMAREQIKVPFGYEPPKAAKKGTVLVFETFEDWTNEDMTRLIAWATEKKFVRIILYPQHEETLRRMDIPCQIPYYQRVKQLEQLIKEAEPGIKVDVDAWEGKRKKYTPMDTSLNFLTEKYPGPFFVAMNDRYVNGFVTYKNFEEWIKKVRLVVLLTFHVPLHHKLEAYKERWELLQ